MGTDTRALTLEYRAWCKNGDLLHVETLPDNATTDQRQAARDTCEAKIREAIERDAADWEIDTSDDYHVQYCEGDRDMTGHEFYTHGDF